MDNLAQTMAATAPIIWLVLSTTYLLGLMILTTLSYRPLELRKTRILTAECMCLFDNLLLVVSLSKSSVEL